MDDLHRWHGIDQIEFRALASGEEGGGVLHCSSAPGYIRTTSPSHLGSMGVALVMH